MDGCFFRHLCFGSTSDTHDAVVFAASERAGFFMLPRNHTVGFFSSILMAGVFAWFICPAQDAMGAIIFEENFDGLTSELMTAEDEWIIDPALLGWTHATPEGWSIDNTTMGTGGVIEWRGWSFATLAFWDATNGQLRGDFTRSSGVFAIADPDEWQDLAFDGLFNSFLSTPPIGVSAGVQTYLSFDSHWRPYANQTARITVSFGGAHV